MREGEGGRAPRRAPSVEDGQAAERGGTRPHAGEAAGQTVSADGTDEATEVRVALPAHLRDLAGVRKEVAVQVEGPPTARSVLDALEAAHPQLAGTIRDHGSGERRAFIRYFACGADLSFEPDDAPLPEAVARGEEVFRVVGAISGG